ncbi:hypothetical protein GALMADRAFT_104017 [Galerina marginata CBS 339.88]|uniref:Calcineurin-like phosphoesterase domain-containing protein n=1 Tax=Galerina marginata (strain CBS 339.88) TaxID=685588 RepID=A0A067SHS0_GALM3|nr:hypothetical protein GALMADRAFT_104017 [Galerina marginata CBS 339.88]
MVFFGAFVTLFALVCLTVDAKPATNTALAQPAVITSRLSSTPATFTRTTFTRTTSTRLTSTSTSTTAFFATPPASLSVPADFTAGPFFATDFLHAFFKGLGPTQTSLEPQPFITDPVSRTVFPLDLTNPKTIPTQNVNDPVVLPPSLLINSPTVISTSTNLSTSGSIRLRQIAFNDIAAIINNTANIFSSTCQQCIASLVIYKGLALTAPWEVPQLLIEMCHFVNFNALGGCEVKFMASSDGQIATQLLANADVTGQDGLQWICARNIIGLLKSCPQPPPNDLTNLLSTWFKKPKPHKAVAPPPSGKQNLRVVHLSDFHIDPRYTIGAEAKCENALCCRPGVSSSTGQLLLPAPRFGSFECDTPWNLASAVMHAIGPLTGTANGTNHGGVKNKNSFTIFTGDLTSHDNDNQLSRAYVEYVESAVYSLFKAYLAGPVYAVMGNHDTWPQAFDAPHSIQPQTLSNQFEWDYGHLADLWEVEGWISPNVAKASKTTYSAYSTITPFGLKIITLNTDFWYKDKQTTNPDVSGMLRFLTDELQAAEDAGQRVWILGHVLPGWDGTAVLINGPNLFYQIVDRFSPHVIANVFMGHIHDEVRYIYYANNASAIDNTTALATTWVGGSVTPVAGLNSGFSMYEVDPVTFDVMEAYTWFADVDGFKGLDNQTEVGVAYHFEYSTRETYGGGFDWPETAPLNATWWHFVTESMHFRPTLVDAWTLHQGRQSALTRPCNDTCRQAKICYMRSGSPPIAAQLNCSTGFGNVQQ